MHECHFSDFDSCIELRRRMSFFWRGIEATHKWFKENQVLCTVNKIFWSFFQKEEKKKVRASTTMGAPGAAACPIEPRCPPLHRPTLNPTVTNIRRMPCTGAGIIRIRTSGLHTRGITLDTPRVAQVCSSQCVPEAPSGSPAPKSAPSSPSAVLWYWGTGSFQDYLPALPAAHWGTSSSHTGPGIFLLIQTGNNDLLCSVCPGPQLLFCFAFSFLTKESLHLPWS